ncbi:MAG: ATP-binding protein [Acidimicrobiia bacterium]
MSSVSLPADTSAASAARRFVRDALSGAGLRDEAVSDVELLVSELVTNAVIHARSASRVTIDYDGSRVRVTVADESPARPELLDRGAHSVTGRGLLLVQQIAHRWGVDIPGEPAAKRVWFELDVAPATWVARRSRTSR